MSDDLKNEFPEGYKPPVVKTVDELLKADAEDESLNRYKDMLLGQAKEKAIPFPENPKTVILQKLAIIVEGRPDVEINLTGDVSKLKDKPIVLKEGTSYRVKLYFYVQREIVSGMKYVLASYRGPLRVDKDSIMVGSYGPRNEIYEWTSQSDEAPKGMLARGTYVIKSRFTDDDNQDHLTWEWSIKIREDWKD